MAVALGDDFTVAVGESGKLFVFGNNIEELTREIENLEPVRQVAAGEKHTGIVTEAGNLLMCGFGRHGRLGLGDEKDRATPTLVPQAVFGGEAVLMVACGFAHTAAVTETGGVYTFGHGKNGRLGHGNEQNQLVPTRVPAANFKSERVVMVAAGDRHTVALSKAGHVFTWGGGLLGQLGHGDQNNELAPRQVDAPGVKDKEFVFIAAGGDHTVAVTAGGQLYTWGCSTNGQLGHGNTNNTLVPTLVDAEAFGRSAVVMAACGNLHTLAVTADGALWACGHGRKGRLGLNDKADKHKFERVGGTTGGAFGGARIVTAAAGDQHSAAVTEDGALWTWGKDAQFSQLVKVLQSYAVPMAVGNKMPEDARIGRCRRLPEDKALAFAMGTHERLGVQGSKQTGSSQASPVSILPPEMVHVVSKWGWSWPTGRAGTEEGIVRLLGGGLILLDSQSTTVQKTGKSLPALNRVKVCRPCNVFLSI